jgi:hypothetical protein
VPVSRFPDVLVLGRFPVPAPSFGRINAFLPKARFMLVCLILEGDDGKATKVRMFSHGVLHHKDVKMLVKAMKLLARRRGET